MKKAVLLGWAMLCAALACAGQARGYELFCGRRSCYEVLGLNRTATSAQIKRAYRTMALDSHPDRNVGKSAAEKDEQAAKFKLVQTAYDHIKDNDSRTEYEDYLTHPHKYYMRYATGFAGEYAPEADVKLVLLALLLLASGLHWANMSLNYKSMLRRIKSSPPYKKKVAELLASGQASSIEEADDALLRLLKDVQQKPHWKMSLPVVLAKLPLQTARLTLWALHWLVAYRFLKRDYNQADQVYLTRQELGVREDDWSELPQDERDRLVQRKLWIKKNMDEFMRSKRVALNRAGARKKPRPRRSQPTFDETFVE